LQFSQRCCLHPRNPFFFLAPPLPNRCLSGHSPLCFFHAVGDLVLGETTKYFSFSPNPALPLPFPPPPFLPEASFLPPCCRGTSSFCKPHHHLPARPAVNSFMGRNHGCLNLLGSRPPPCAFPMYKPPHKPLSLLVPPPVFPRGFLAL